MRILQLVTGEKWTGTAAVVFDQTAALVEAGIEAQFGFTGDSPLARRLASLGWARPILRRPRGPVRFLQDAEALRAMLAREKFELVHAHATHDHYLAAFAVAGPGSPSCARCITPGMSGKARSRVRSGAGPALSASPTGRSRRSSALAARSTPRSWIPAGFPGREALGAGPRPGAAGPYFLVGTVGKLAAGRGHDEAIRVLGGLPGGAALLHVGKGDDEHAFASFAASLGLADRNFWTGYQEEELPALYRSMEAFLFTASAPSRDSARSSRRWPPAFRSWRSTCRACATW